MNRSNKNSLVFQLRNIENRIQALSKRSDDPALNNSEFKELTKRQKKLLKTKEKLQKKLDFHSVKDYNE